MKYIVSTVVALSGLSNALPRPQYDQATALPSFSLATPTSSPGSGSGSGSDSGSGTGSGEGKPSALPLPTGGAGGGFDLGGLLGGLFGGGKLPNLPGASGIPVSGSKPDLEGLLGGLFGGGKQPSLPGASGTPGSGSGFDLGSLLGGGKLPSLLGGTGSSGSGLGNGFAGFSGGETGSANPGTGSDWTSLLGGGNRLGNGFAGSKPSEGTPVPSKTVPVTTPSETGSTGGDDRGSGSGGNCKGASSKGGSSENGVRDDSCCTDMTVIFARGTGEPGNVGIVSGPPMFKALRSKLGEGRVTIQGVEYPASTVGNANMGGDGGKKMADLVTQALTQCPNTKVIVSGYSQGAMVVHNAFKNGLSASKVVGAVMFGDPLKRQAVGDLPADKVKQFCGTADQICGGGGDGGATGSHISYGGSADAAATFAIQAAGLA